MSTHSFDKKIGLGGEYFPYGLKHPFYGLSPIPKNKKAFGRACKRRTREYWRKSIAKQIRDENNNQRGFHND